MKLLKTDRELSCDPSSQLILAPYEQNRAYSFKTVGDALNDLSIIYLEKLKQAAKQLNFNTTAEYRLEISKVNEEDEFKALGQILSRNLPKESTEAIRLYET